MKDSTGWIMIDQSLVGDAPEKAINGMDLLMVIRFLPDHCPLAVSERERWIGETEMFIEG